MKLLGLILLCNIKISGYLQIRDTFFVYRNIILWWRKPFDPLLKPDEIGQYSDVQIHIVSNNPICTLLTTSLSIQCCRWSLLFSLIPCFLINCFIMFQYSLNYLFTLWSLLFSLIFCFLINCFIMFQYSLNYLFTLFLFIWPSFCCIYYWFVYFWLIIKSELSSPLPMPSCTPESRVLWGTKMVCLSQRCTNTLSVHPLQQTLNRECLWVSLFSLQMTIMSLR